MSNAVFDKLKRDLERKAELAEAKKESLNDTLKEVWKNKDLKAQIAQELNALRSGQGGNSKFREGYNVYEEPDSAMQPLDYED